MYSYCAHFASCIFDKHLLIYTFINMIRLISLLIGSISTLDFSFVEDGYRVNTTRSRSSRMWPNQQRLACFRAIRPAGSWDHACSNARLAATGLDRRRPMHKVNLTGGNRSGLTGYRSNRSGPVPVPAGTQPAKIQILNLNSKNKKFSKNS